MSTTSRLRHIKQASPESGRPRQRNARPSEKPLNITQFQDVAHKANVASKTKKLRGAFGGCTRLEREIRAGRNESLKQQEASK